MSNDENILTLPDRDGTGVVDEAAIEWLVRLDGADQPETLIPGLRSWLSSDPEHLRAFQHWLGVWGSVDDEFNQLAAKLVETVSKKSAKRRRLIPVWQPVGALVATACLAFAFLFNFVEPAPDAAAPAVYATQVGFQKTVNLSDGSVITLNSGSVAEVDISTNRRMVSLLEGEVFFDIEKDPTRPFFIHVKDKRIRVVGTAFSVRRTAESVSVIVAEGEVEFASLSNPGVASADVNVESKIILQAQDKLIAANDAPIIKNKLDAETIDRDLAWQTGFIVFDDQPLSEIIEEFSRYTLVDIEIADPSLRDFKVTGRFKVDSVDSFFEVLELSFGINVIRRNGEKVYLARRI